MDRESARRALIAAVLTAAVCTVYLPTLGNGFIDFHDDVLYVTGNARVRAGLTPAGAAWALTSFEANNWHPLTWISHMLDVSLFGLDPRGHHLVNLLWHLASTLLLFALLRAATGALWAAAAVAALFCVHPLHVESVAWVAERKDVLSTFLWLLTIAAYLRYARRPGRGRALAVAGLCALGLAAKPMLVTLPLTLLLLDYWPLGRTAAAAAPGHPHPPLSRPLALEKIPLAGLAAAAGALTYAAQSRGGLVRSWQSLPLPARLENAAVAAVRYLGKALWPQDLAFFYPLQPLPLAITLGSAALLAALTVGALRAARSRPHLAVGWLWYVLTLLPVIGIVQVGSQAMADRYTYVPLLGLFVALVWEAARWSRPSPPRRAALAVVGVAALLALTALARAQVGHWKDAGTLYRHSLAAGGEDWLLRSNLGLFYARQGRADLAVAEYERSLRLKPDAVFPLVNLGVALAQRGRLAEARERFARARQLQPQSVEILNNLGLVLERQGERGPALEAYREALRLRPGDPGTLGNIERIARPADPAAASPR